MNTTELPGGQISGGDTISAPAEPSPDLATTFVQPKIKGSEILWRSMLR